MIVGPFTGEVGYELLYWIPYLRHRLGPTFKDATAITRGGAGVWYPSKTLEAMDAVGTDAFIKGVNSRPQDVQKPYEDDPLDNAILQALDLKTDIHPSACIKRAFSQTSENAASYPHERLPKVERYPGLPEHYTAIRFYHSKVLQSLTTAQKLAQQAMDNGPTVIMLMDGDIDDHPNYLIPGTITIRFAPRESLSVASRIIAHARAFVATYGGLSYLGPLYGVPTFAVSDCPIESPHNAQENRMIEAVSGIYLRINPKTNIQGRMNLS